MTEETGSGEDNQISNQQLLESLADKERNPEIAEIVAGILSSDNGTEEKIRLIKVLDSSIENQSTLDSEEPVQSVRVPMPGTEKKREKKEELSFVIDDFGSKAVADTEKNRQRLMDNRRALKPFIPRVSFFRYLFKENRDIFFFADKTKVLAFKFLGMKMILNPLVVDVFSANISGIIRQLIKIMDSIVDEGWRILEKRDYNLIVLLSRLCSELNHFNFESLQSNSPDLIDNLLKAEIYFLMLHYEQSDVKQLKYAIDTVLGRDPSTVRLQKEAGVKVSSLLEQDSMKPSLFNLFIGLNTLKTRAYLEMNDLRTPGLQLIDIHDYDCDPKIRSRIDEHLRELEKEVRYRIDRQKEAYSLHAFVPLNEKGVMDFSHLQTFYDTALRTERFIYKAHKDNIIKFIVNLTDAFLAVFRGILTATAVLDNGESVRILGEGIFGHDILRIESNLGRLKKIQLVLPHFATSRCLSLKRSMSGAIESEANAIQCIYDIAGHLVNIGKRLEHILRNAMPSSPIGKDSGEILFFSFSEQNFAIPYESCEIEIPSLSQNMSVHKAFIKIVTICYQTGAFVRHDEMADMIGKEKKISSEIRRMSEEYKRIAHEKVYRAFAKKYHLGP
jgi:hypothetical protein